VAQPFFEYDLNPSGLTADYASSIEGSRGGDFRPSWPAHKLLEINTLVMLSLEYSEENDGRLWIKFTNCGH
jgi:hypothetical protein